MPRTRTDGAVIDYEEGGRGAPLVLVHGAWLDHQSWGAVRPQLERSFRTIVYSRRGHGASAGSGRLDDDVRDLTALIEKVAGGQAHLAGNSLGATICLRAAAARPELIASLSAHEPPLLALIADDPELAPHVGEVSRRVGGVLALIEQGAPEQAAQRFVDDVALGPGAWNAMGPDERSTFVRHAGTFAEENADPDIYALDRLTLSAVTCPVFLTGGDASPPLFRAILERLAAMLPRVARHEFPGAGHLPHATHPRAYADAVADFAARAEALVDGVMT